MKTTLILMALFFLAVTPALAQQKVAVVKLLRGDAEVTLMDKSTKLKVDDWVVDGAVIKTKDKSFVKLVFIDKSQMNVGPNSEMKIESFSGKDSGVIDLVKGKIRSQVTKDYLQMKDQDKSKLFIKTPNAVMGVRGTDFMISTNGQNTSTVLFEGEIVFNKLDANTPSTSAGLEAVVDRGVRIHPGEFSVVEANRPEPTVPSLLNVQQRETLEKNDNFESDRSPASSAAAEPVKSVVPAGLSGQVVSNSSQILKTEVASAGGVATERAPVATGNPDGFVDGDKVKPANGSSLHVESGLIIPPGPGSVLDANTNTYIPSQANGTIGTDGNYVPPQNVQITDDGKIMVTTTNSDGQVSVNQVAAPAPVVSTSPMDASLGSAPLGPPPTMVLNHDVGMLPPPNNSLLNDIRNSNQVEQKLGITTTNTTIIVTP